MDNLDLEIKNLIEGFLTDLDERNILEKIDKKEIEKSFSKHLKISLGDERSELFFKIKEKFSGKGRAWILINKDENLWNKVINCITIHENLSLKDNEYFLNLKDLFETKKIAWIRFGGLNKKHAVFHIRHKGSKLENHIKLDLTYEEAINCNMLDSNPHKLKLEEGIFDLSVNYIKKEVIKEPEGFDLNTISPNIISLESL
jgi:hypothetical protein